MRHPVPGYGSSLWQMPKEQGRRLGGVEENLPDISLTALFEVLFNFCLERRLDFCELQRKESERQLHSHCTV